MFSRRSGNALVASLYTKGRATGRILDYRLLSITSVAARTIERVVQGHLIRRVESQLAAQQAGFRKRHNTSDNIFRTLRAIHAAMDRKSVLPVVFLDIAKAFDSVHHPSLLLKLHRMGVSDHMWWFIRAFLTNRFCAIWGDGATSDWFRVAAGVPQGSVLAPLLYAIFINDLVPDITQNNECECCLFADDVNIWPVARDADGVDRLRHRITGPTHGECALTNSKRKHSSRLLVTAVAHSKEHALNNKFR